MGNFAVVRPGLFILPLACIAAAAMVFISEGSYRQSVRTLDALGAMGDAPANIQSLRWATLDAQAAARGYLLTGRADYVRLHEDADRRIAQSFAFLDHYFAGVPAPLEVLQTLHGLTRTEQADFARLLERKAAGRNDAGSDMDSRILGADRMDAVRRLSAQLLTYETADVAASRHDLYRTLMFGRAGIAALSAVSLLAVFLHLRRTRTQARQQRDRQLAGRAERDQLEREVALRTARLTDLTRHLQTAREDERSRLARDMHDELGALLTSAKLDAARLKSRLPADAPEALERLQHLVATLNSVITLKRRIIEDLRPSALTNLGLVATLEILAREYAAGSGAAVHCDFAPVSLTPSAELVVYRLVQEAITNISKYAKARNVWLRLARKNGQVEVSVHDDGVGFDVGAAGGSAHGLLGMRFRVESEGGVLTVISAPGHDTLILASLPEHAAVAA